MAFVEDSASTNERRPSGGLAAELVVVLGRVERAVISQLAKVLAESGCSVEAWRALSLLVDGGPHPMTRLAEAALVPGPNLTRLVDRLVADNLVYRRGDERDRRRVLACPTERGRALQRDLAARIEEERELILGGASVADVERLIDLLDRPG